MTTPLTPDEFVTYSIIAPTSDFMRCIDCKRQIQPFQFYYTMDTGEVRHCDCASAASSHVPCIPDSKTDSNYIGFRWNAEKDKWEQVIS